MIQFIYRMKLDKSNKNKDKFDTIFYLWHLLPVMKNKNRRSYIMEAIQLLILLENKPDYKIAADCDVSPSTILNIRHGNHFPSVCLAEHIYETLSGESIEDIFNQ